MKTMISAQTKADLQEIVAKYCLASDQKDVPAHMEFYAQEGYIDGGMRSRPRNGGMEEDLAQMFAMEGTLKRHLAMNFIFEQQNEKIKVKYLLLVIEGDTSPAVIVTAQVEDIFIQEKGEWKIELHTVKIDPAMFNLLKSQDTGIDSKVFHS